MDKHLEVGQCWYFDDKKEAYLYILKIEELVPNVIFCHVAIEGLHINGPDGRILHTAGHLPFEYESVQKSVTEMRSANEPLPDFQDGYQQWKAAFDQQKAGVYNISVSESLELIEKMFNT